jgi:hypothetical protein
MLAQASNTCANEDHHDHAHGHPNGADDDADDDEEGVEEDEEDAEDEGCHEGYEDHHPGTVWDGKEAGKQTEKSQRVLSCCEMS